MTHLALRQSSAEPVPTLRRDLPAALSEIATRPTTAPGLELALVQTFAGFEALAADWTELHQRAGRPENIFQAYNWCWHWCRHYLGGPRQAALAVVTGRRAGRLVLVLPLATERFAGLTELLWLGEPVSQYGDALVDAALAMPGDLDAAWASAVEETRADVANLRRVRADAHAAPLLARLGAAVTAVEEAPYLDLTGDASFEAWEARRKPRAIKNRRRQSRRLAEEGPMCFASHEGSSASATLAAHAIRLKRDTLAEKGGISPALADTRFQAFFEDAVHGHGRPTGARVATLTSNGLPAALKILIDDPRTSFLHIAVFEPRYEKCGAGALLLEQAISDAIETGRTRLDLLPPRHDYKMDFADGVIPVSDYALALSAKGTLYKHGYLKVRRTLKAAVEALPLPVRRAIAKLTAHR